MIEIDKRGGGGKISRRELRCDSRVREASLAVVVVKRARATAQDEKIGLVVVVVVTGDCGCTGVCGGLGECA